jgi:hypothetical protein
MTLSYKIALATDCIAVLVALYFIVSDSIRQSSSDNGLLTMVTLVFCAWVGLSYYLYHHGQPKIASMMAWVPAVPLLGYGLIILLFVVFKPDMR